MTIYIMNANRKINFSKPVLDKEDSEVLIVKKRNGTFIAVRNFGKVLDFNKVGDYSLITIDTGHRYMDGGSGRVVGIVTPDATEGDVPTQKIPLYIFK